MLVSTTNIGVLKGAANPNAAPLFTAFKLSSERTYVRIRSEYYAYTFLKGKDVIFMEGQDPKVVERVANEYSRILGCAR